MTILAIFFMIPYIFLNLLFVGSDDSSPMLTSDPTSDSSDTGGSGKCNDEPNSVNNGWDASSMKNTSENGNQSYQKSTADEKKAKDEDMRDSVVTKSEHSQEPDNVINILNDGYVHINRHDYLENEGYAASSKYFLLTYRIIILIC